MLPRVILHNAISVDGRIDWIAPDIGLFYELASRFGADAMLAGADTLLGSGMPADDESEGPFPPTEKSADDRRPLVVVPDSRGRLRHWGSLRQAGYWRDVVALCSHATAPGYLRYLRARHVEYIVAGGDHVDLRAALEELNARFAVNVVQVDSGGTLNGVLLRAGLVDEVSLLIDPSLVGGMTPRSIFRAPDLASAEGVVRLKLTHCERVRDDVVWLRYAVIR